MKVSDFSIYIMKIMWRDFKKNSFETFQRYSKIALKVQILNEIALRQVVRKRFSFQECKNENTPKFLALKYDIKQHSDAT